MNRRSVLKSSLSLAALGTATPIWASVPVVPTNRGWTDLKGITIHEIVTDTTYEVIKTFPQSLQEGLENIELTGYATPITPGSMIHELVLISDLESCPYCSVSDHNASAFVKLKTPIPEFPQNTSVRIQGRFTPNLDPTTWEAAIIEDAVVTGFNVA